MKRLYTAEKYIVDDLFENEFDYEDNSQERIEELRNKDIAKYRMKTIKSGDILECEIYPIWKTNNKDRAQKAKKSRDAQKNLNNKNTLKNLIRLLNANFTSQDIWATFTYDNEHLPSTIEEAQKDMQNYIRRLKTYVKRNNLEELKYIYVTEYRKTENKVRVHHHIVLNFKDRDKAEQIWKGGSRTQTRRLQPDELGLEGLARYILKDPKGSKRYVVSKNLTKPIITVADSKMTRGRVNKIVERRIDAISLFQKIYKGYSFTDMKIFFSEYVAGAYLYIRMIGGD